MISWKDLLNKFGTVKIGQEEFRMPFYQEEKIMFTSKIDRYIREARAYLVDPDYYTGRRYARREQEVPRDTLIEFESAILTACAIIYKDIDQSRIVSRISGFRGIDWVRVLDEIRSESSGILAMTKIFNLTNDSLYCDETMKILRLYRLKTAKLEHSWKGSNPIERSKPIVQFRDSVFQKYVWSDEII